MSRVLSELLDAPEPLFTFHMRELERTGGQPNVDIRLTADIKAKLHQKLRELGLDPNDTNGQELYHTLQNLVKLHDNFLAHAIGAQGATTAEAVLPQLKAAIDRLDVPRSGWFIKHSAAKRLLKAMPPKRVMRQLNYKSIDSMLKRENVAELYAAIRFAERPTWQKKFIESYKKLQPKDFESRDIEVIVLDRQRWGSLANEYILVKHHNLTHLKELGVMAILPLPVERLEGLTITLLPLMLYYLNDIRLYSSYFKLQQVKPDFADTIVKTLLHDMSPISSIGDQPIGWRVVHRHFSEHAAEHPELFEPHVQPEDFIRRTAEKVLYKLEPALKFWEGLDYIGMYADGRAVPLSLMDNAVSFCNRLPYGRQATSFFTKDLWHELLKRYIGTPIFERHVVKRLDETLMPAPELVPTTEDF